VAIDRDLYVKSHQLGLAASRRCGDEIYCSWGILTRFYCGFSRKRASVMDVSCQPSVPRRGYREIGGR